jgi:hypothetical protein
MSCRELHPTLPPVGGGVTEVDGNRPPNRTQVKSPVRCRAEVRCRLTLGRHDSASTPTDGQGEARADRRRTGRARPSSQRGGEGDAPDPGRAPAAPRHGGPIATCSCSSPARSRIMGGKAAPLLGRSHYSPILVVAPTSPRPFRPTYGEVRGNRRRHSCDARSYWSPQPPDPVRVRG